MKLVRSGIRVAILSFAIISAHPEAAAQVLPIVERKAFEIAHPEPRAESSPNIMTGRRLERAPIDVRLTYLLAAEIPSILDGIHSYCHEGRSLLSCFESAAAATSPLTLRVAQLAFLLHHQGHDLEYIRSYLDAGRPLR